MASKTAAVLVRGCEFHDVPAAAAVYGYAVLTGCASSELDPPNETEMCLRWEALLAEGYPYRRECWLDTVLMERGVGPGDEIAPSGRAAGA